MALHCLSSGTACHALSQFPHRIRQRPAAALTQPASLLDPARHSAPQLLHAPRGRCDAVMIRSMPDDAASAGRAMASDFAAFVLESGTKSPAQQRGPSHLMPPTEVVAAQLHALQRNDWPEPDAGVRTAFAFTKPQGAEQLLPGQVSGGRAASWGGVERWLPFADFSNQLHSPPFSVLLHCDSWQAISAMTFPRQRSAERALQAVQVRARRRHDDPQGPVGLRHYTFTFCLERVDIGPYKGCWLTVGLRAGDYANV